MNTQQQAAMQMALEALHNTSNALLFVSADGYSVSKMAADAYDDAEKAIIALREALAQREQQGWMPIETAPRNGRILVTGTDIGTCVASAGWDNDTPDTIRWEVVNDIVVTPTHWMPIPYWNLKQRKQQEPKVAPDGRVAKTVFTLEDIQKATEMGYESGKAEAEALAQPQGEWVDLTDDELLPIWNKARAVIAAFKEKNTPVQREQQGCDYCNNPLFAGTKCKNCGREQQEPVDLDDLNTQDWSKVDNCIAWHLIERHADSWKEVGQMMDELVACRVEAMRIETLEKAAKVCDELFDTIEHDWSMMEGAGKCAAAIRSMK